MNFGGMSGGPKSPIKQQSEAREIEEQIRSEEELKQRALTPSELERVEDRLRFLENSPDGALVIDAAAAVKGFMKIAEQDISSYFKRIDEYSPEQLENISKLYCSENLAKVQSRKLAMRKLVEQFSPSVNKLKNNEELSAEDMAKISEYFGYLNCEKRFEDIYIIKGGDNGVLVWESGTKKPSTFISGTFKKAVEETVVTDGLKAKALIEQELIQD